MNTNKPIVAIIGRPNVGKSTLFNRITDSNLALVDNFPGVTRDRIYKDVEWEGRWFSLVDTGGFSDEDEKVFVTQIRQQTEYAIEEANIIVLVLDGKTGLSPYDKDLINIIRRTKKPVLYAVNKIDTKDHEKKIYDFYSQGLSTLYPVSSEHGYGVSELLDAIKAYIPEPENPEPYDESKDDGIIKLAIVGKPNTGKSSLINKIIGQERFLVSDIPGTTRDSVDTLFQKDDKLYKFIDTAGIRRKSKVSEKIEIISVMKSLKSLERCHIALIVVDAYEGLSEQDIKVAGYAYERGCGCLFVVNKWDLVKEKDIENKKIIDNIRDKAKFLNYAPILTVSALTGLRMNKIFQEVDNIYEQYSRNISTSELNNILKGATSRHEAPIVKGKQVKFFYCTQVSTKPPTILCFVNYPLSVHFSYKRFLINHFRESTGLDITPIKLIFKERTRK